MSSSLQQVMLRVVRPRVCRRKFRTMTSGMICAGGQEGKDSCQSDSGGPLTVRSGSGQHVLIGVNSHGHIAGCGSEGYPGVFTRISRYRTWIERNMKSPRYCSRGLDTDQ